MAEIVPVTRQDIIYPFTNTAPYVPIGAGTYRRQVQVDVFPCYPHEEVLVRRELAHCKNVWPLPFPLSIYILPVEELTRTNGCFMLETIYTVPQTYAGNIVLSGKRIPPHPASTRYVVAHEYGHAVEEAIAAQRGLKLDSDAILGEYAEMRGLSASPTYGGGNWHLSVGEVFANDFRILLAGIETEFWPHPGIPRSEEVPAAIAWWEAAKEGALV